MKTFRATGVMSVFAILLVAYTAWEYKKTGNGEVDTPQERRLFQFKNEDVQQIQFIHPTSRVVIDRVDNGWKMTEPVTDLVESTAIDALLYSVLIQKGKVFRSPDDGKDKPVWSEFGLAPPGTTLEIKTPKGTERLEVSSKNAFDGSFYLRQGDDLLLGEPGLAQAVLRDYNTFRSRKLFRFTDATVTDAKVEVNAAGEGRRDQYAVHLEGDKWTLTPAPAFPVDPERIKTWLTALQNLTPSEVVGESLTADAKKNFLLTKPSFVATLNVKKADGKTEAWTLTMGQDKDQDIYLFTSSAPTVYKTSKSSTDAVRVTREHFRDGRAPFRFPVEQAQSVEIFSGKLHFNVRRDSGTWSLVDGGENQLNAEKFSTLLQNLGTLEAQEFLRSSDGKGFKPEQKIVVKDGKGQILREVSWGDTFKGKSTMNGGAELRYVKVNGEKSVLGVNSSKVRELIDPGLTEKKPKAAAEPKTK